MIGPDEVRVLSFYAASELAGVVLLGRLALHTTIDRLRAPLIEQCMEEARHAWLFTKAIVDLDATPVRVSETYQSEVGKAFGMPEGMLDILCLTRVLEVAVLEHYRRNAARPGLHPIVRGTLERVIEDESGHVDWVQAELERYAGQHGAQAVEDAIRRAERASQAALARLLASPTARAYFEDRPL